MKSFLLFSADSGANSDILHEVALPLVSKEECEKIHNKLISNSQLCAGGKEASIPKNWSLLFLSLHILGLRNLKY